MEGSFCIFGLSPNGKVRGNINPNFAKPWDVSGNFTTQLTDKKCKKNISNE